MLYQNTFLTVYIICVAGVLGACMGSFVNCMAWRTTHGESIMKGRSHCAICDHTLGPLDLIPIFSYIFLRGRCRYCKEKISPRYFLVEIISAMAFMLIIARYDITMDSLKYLVLILILLCISLIDLETFEIPDSFIIAGIVWWVVMVPFHSFGWQYALKTGLIGGVAMGGGMLIISVIFDKLTGKESLGGGDIKLFFMTGLYLGLALSLFNLIVACIVGIVFVIVLRQSRIPFGPAISIAVFITLMTGSQVVNWYLGLFY